MTACIRLDKKSVIKKYCVLFTGVFPLDARVDACIVPVGCGIDFLYIQAYKKAYTVLLFSIINYVLYPGRQNKTVIVDCLCILTTPVLNMKLTYREYTKHIIAMLMLYLILIHRDCLCILTPPILYMKYKEYTKHIIAKLMLYFILIHCLCILTPPVL